LVATGVVMKSEDSNLIGGIAEKWWLKRLMFKRYKIKQQISYKAGRSTYLADDYETNKQVVIKILEFNDLFDWDTFKLFEREAKTLKSLSHPNIPQFLDYLEINEENCQGFPQGNFYGSALIQTYIDAPSLAEVIEQEIHFRRSKQWN